jgi:tetratricopeptide (TPR) repeat protein
MTRDANTPPVDPAKAAAVSAKLEQDFRVASGHHGAGRLDEAKKVYEDIRRRAPNNSGVLHFLGVIAHQQGDSDKAIALMTQAIDEDDGVYYFHGNLGEVYRSLERYDEAIACCRRAIEIYGVNPDALNILGAALHAKGEFTEAEASLRRAIEFKPDHVIAHGNLGNVLKSQGKLDDAVAAYQHAIELHPDFTGVHAALGGARHAQGRLTDAIACYRKALEIDPNDAMVLSDLAVSLRAAGEVDEAVDSLRQAIRLRPGFAEGHVNLGTMLLHARQDLDGAMDSYQTALRFAPDLVEALQGMADTLAVQGDFDQAVEYSRRALKIDPDHMAAHLALAHAGDLAGDGDDLARLEAQLDGGGLSKADECDLRFALGTAHDRAGAYDSAFAHFQAGNQLKSESGAFDLAAFAATVGRQIEGCTADFFTQRTSWGRDSERPLFIVGMPRSGTTLVEQIVSSHPEVFGGGELEAFRAMALELPTTLGTDVPAAECTALVDPDGAQRLADRYLAHLDTLDANALRVTDKMPGNFQRLDLVALLFPGARVIHCRRSPLDVCLSCYFHDFSQGHAYTYDLAELGAYYRQYERLMDHWQNVLPIAMLDVTYEELISDQETVSRRMIDFCGVPWDDACLNFQDNDRSVFTSSMWQVRQPLYQTSIDRWRHYDSHLGPLKSALGTTDI